MHKSCSLTDPDMEHTGTANLFARIMLKGDLVVFFFSSIHKYYTGMGVKAENYKAFREGQ